MDLVGVLLIQFLIAIAVGIALLPTLRDLRVYPVHAAAYFGVGAFVGADSLAYVPELPLSLLVASVSAGLLGYFSASLLRNRSADQRLLLLVAVQVIFQILAQIAPAITGGPGGEAVIQAVSVLGVGLSQRALWLSIVAFLAMTSFLAWLFQRRYGATLSLVGTGESYASGLGLNPSRYTAMVFIVAAMLTGMAGDLSGIFTGYIEPAGYGFDQSIWFIVVAVFATWRAAGGALLGGAMVVGLTELLRFLNLSALLAGEVRGILAGAILCIVVFLSRRKALAQLRT